MPECAPVTAEKSLTLAEEKGGRVYPFSRQATSIVGLPKANRLQRGREFKAVYKKGRRCSGKYLILRAFRDISPAQGEAALPPTQVGISISQKVSKKAVVRNRIKRQIRAIIRSLLPQLPSGWKIVVIVKPQAQGCKYEDFLRELKQLLITSEVLHGD